MKRRAIEGNSYRERRIEPESRFTKRSSKGNDLLLTNVKHTRVTEGAETAEEIREEAFFKNTYCVNFVVWSS